MTDQYISRELEKFGVQYSNKTFTYSKKSWKSLQWGLDSSEIRLISIEKSDASLMRKIIFWFSRILTWDKNEQRSLWQDKLDYREDYKLVFRLSRGDKKEVRIRHFDRFKLAAILDHLNGSL